MTAVADHPCGLRRSELNTYYIASGIGGTFTDPVVIDKQGDVGRYKSPTIPADLAEGVLTTLKDAANGRDMGLW